jgi:hypothetical protein
MKKDFDQINCLVVRRFCYSILQDILDRRHGVTVGVYLIKNFMTDMGTVKSWDLADIYDALEARGGSNLYE